MKLNGIYFHLVADEHYQPSIIQTKKKIASLDPKSVCFAGWAWPNSAPASVGPLLNETKCHLVSFSLLTNQTKWHLVWSFKN